ncbi:MAG: LysM peptidoglycan-binding domain-containing protein [Desulfovibrionaceae bacterium]|nr:LysM peptidoglycan-binding domain-containing protein [Desulfovibrionaceae bacterium]
MNHSLSFSPSRRLWHVLRNLALGAGCAVLLAGCGANPRLDAPQAPLAAAGPSDEDMLESYRLALQDEGLPLSDVEMRALLSTGEVDRGLGTDDMREVQVYFKHYIHSARPVVERFMRRGQSYIGYTRRIFRERGLPEELAYLAFVESGYNPVAVSRSNAVGMWQFMAGTGRQYGLRQDWWMDERRDPYHATRAAADYLAKLYGDFRDWHLAVAAYNAGEGKIGRALQGTQTETFFALCRSNELLDDKAQLKEETRQYVPRFLAVCKIMRNAEALGFSPAEAVDTERVLQPVAELSARPGTDLAALAGRLNMSWDEFAAYNPAFRRYITPPDRYVPVYVPSTLQAQASLALRDASLTGSGWTTYTVTKGDSMGRISKRTGVPVSVLRQLNRKSEPLRAGAKLRIPGRAGAAPVSVASDKGSSPARAANSAKAANPARAASPAKAPASSQAVAASARDAAPSPATAPAGTSNAAPAGAAIPRGAATHTVQRGDTLASLSRRYGVSVAAISAANPGLANPRSLRAGQVLNLPGASTGAAGSTAVAGSAATAPDRAAQANAQAVADTGAGTPATHTVRPGDTLASLARYYGVSMGAISAANPGLADPHSLRVGQVLNVPGASAVSQAGADSSVKKVPARASTAASGAGRGVTTHTVRRGDTLASLSRRYGVSVAALSAANPQLNPRSLRVGQTITVPAAGSSVSAAPSGGPATYRVQPGDTMWGIARKFNIPPADLLALNNMKDAGDLHPGDFVRVTPY